MKPALPKRDRLALALLRSGLAPQAVSFRLQLTAVALAGIAGGHTFSNQPTEGDIHG